MKNVIEDNKLIAEFKKEKKYSLNGEYLINNIIYSENNLCYHISWDWLISVINKIIEDTGWVYVMYDTDGYFVLEGDVKNYGGGYSDITSTHQAVVKFIKWYNENRTND